MNSKNYGFLSDFQRGFLWAVAICCGLILLLSGCASHYIAADKDMSRMSASQLTRELTK